MTITLPDEVVAIARDKARWEGNTVENFITRLITTEPLDYQLPETQSGIVRTREELEQKLMEGLDSLDRGEGIVVTPEFFEQLKRESLARLGLA